MEGKLIKVSYPAEKEDVEALDYTYNSYGWLTKITVTDEHGTRTLREYDYDGLGKVTTIGEYLSDAEGNIAGYIQKNYTYDTFQRVASMSYKDGADKNSVLTEREKYTYEYDKNSNIIKETLVNNYPNEEADRINRTKTYTYNGLGRLTKSVETDNTTGTAVTTMYTYDANGNRLSMTEGSTTTTYQYNKLDQLTKAEEKNNEIVMATTVYSYDANGNQIKESTAQTGVENTYTYDVANQLTQATLKSATGTLVQNNIYNGSGQRIQKTEKLNGVTGTINYYYQDGVVLYTTDAAGEKTSHNLLGLSGNPMATRRYGEEDLYYTYNKDSKGSTTSLVSQPGSSAVTYTYTDFGETEIFGDTDFYNEICYTGGIYDRSTGLYYLNARYYNPEDGRFITQDTYRGEATKPLTWHLYVYCANNPVNFVDPSGHASIPLDFWLGGAAIGLSTLFYAIYDNTKEAAKEAWDYTYNSIKSTVTMAYNSWCKYKEDKAKEKAVEKVATIIKRKRNRYSYWYAVKVKVGKKSSIYLPTKGLKFKTAKAVILSGGNVYAKNKKSAYKLAKSVGNAKPLREWHHKEDITYMPHYHPRFVIRRKNGKTEYGKIGGHIFYAYNV